MNVTEAAEDVNEKIVRNEREKNEFTSEPRINGPTACFISTFCTIAFFSRTRAERSELSATRKTDDFCWRVCAVFLALWS